MISPVVRSLNQASRRRVVPRGRQMKKASVAERVLLLYQTLAESPGSDDQGTVIVLQGSGDDFGCGRRVLVDQNNDGTLLEGLPS